MERAEDAAPVGPELEGDAAVRRARIDEAALGVCAAMRTHRDPVARQPAPEEIELEHEPELPAARELGLHGARNRRLADGRRSGDRDQPARLRRRPSPYRSTLQSEPYRSNRKQRTRAFRSAS